MCVNPRQSWILDSTPRIPDSSYWILVFVSGTRILDSLSCIPDFKAQDVGFHKQNFPGVRIP